MAAPPPGGAPQPAAISDAVQNLVDAIQEFGRIPKRSSAASQDAASQEEDKLARRWSQHKRSIPAHVLEELESLGGRRQELIGQKHIDAVKTLGFFPKETRPKGDEGKEEFLLAMKIRKYPFTPAQRIELNELQRTSMHPRDHAMSTKRGRSC